MESKLLKLQANNDVCAIEKYVETLDIELICSELRNICGKENGVLVLQVLLSGLTSTSSCQEKRMKICKAVLENMEKKLISQRLTEKFVSVLASQLESFSIAAIMTLTESCLQMMRESKGSEGCGCWKDFMPKLLNKIAEEDFVEHNGSTIRGHEYKNQIIIAVCLYEWPDNIITSIASMFVDVLLSPEEHLKVVNKLCKRIPNISLQEIPPLVHQMLQLTKEQHFMPLFLALANIFDEKLYSKLCSMNNIPQDLKGSLKEIQIIEGTVLFHIYSIVSSLGPQSIKDFLKILRDCVNSPAFILSPFAITFLLTISCVSYTFEEEVLNIIRLAIVRNYAEEEKVSDSAWIETVVPPVVSVDEVFVKIIQNCFRERDKVLKGLVNLAFSLLATQKTRGKESQCDKMWNLGNSVLVRLIKKHGDVTNSVLQTLADQISQVHESMQYTDCLIDIVRQNPLNVLDCSAILIQLLDNICARLPGNVGHRVVAGILPLTKMSQSLRDNLIIVLRKSLFPHDKACREMAVMGIVELLKDLKISNLRVLSQSISQSFCGLSQVYSETCTGPGPSHSNEGMCLELLSILREVFKHQQEVKTVLYRGMHETVYVNPELGCHVLDNLQSQFDKFFRPGEELPPLCFEKTVTLQGNTPVLLEPIAQLVLSIGLIVTKVEEGSTRWSKLQEMFGSLCERMSDSDIPHFVSGKEPSDGSPESLVKQEELRQVLGVYEALMGYVLSTWTPESTTHGQMLNSLFRGYCRLSDYVRTLGKSDKKKMEDKVKNSKGCEVKVKEKWKCAPFKFPQTVLNLKCGCRLLSILYESSVPWASEQTVAVIKNKRELHRYCLNVILTLLKQAQSVPATELSRNSTALGYLTKIARIIYKGCVKRFEEMKQFDLQSTVLCLECLSDLIHFILLNFKGKFANFLNEISGNAVENERHNVIKAVLEEILEQLTTLLKDDVDEEAKDEEIHTRKLSLLLINIATCLVNQLQRGSGPDAQQILDKMKYISKHVKVEAPNVAKAFLTLLLLMHVKCKPSGSLLLDLALCLCDNMTLIDDEMKVEEHTKHVIINEKTANACILAVCDTLRFLVNEVEWVVARLKAEILILSLSKNGPMEGKVDELMEKERELCRHINFCMKVISVLCTIAVPPGIYADAVLKEIGNFYNKLTIVTKYFILKVGKYHQQLQNSKFDKIVKVVDHELSKNMYCFTEHVIADGAGSVEDSSSKQLKKDPTFLKNKCLRETKIIPKVIYEKEQFQKFVLQLSNKSKINFVGQTKYALARDYRLYAKQVKEILEKENVQLEEMEFEEDSTSQIGEAEEHRNKKIKLDE